MRPLAIALILALGPGAAGAAPLDDLNRVASRASCLIEANSVVKLSSQVQGVLAKVAVRRGDQVAQGQVVAELESGVELAMLKAARLRAATDATINSKKAELANADRKLDRQRKLAQTQIASAQTLEQAETDVAVLQSQVLQAQLDRDLARVEVERLEATIERRVIRSSVDGAVVGVDHFPGEYADQNTVVATVTEIQPLKVEVYLPLEAYPWVKVGMRAAIQPQGPIPGSFPAEVVTKDPQIDAASGLFQIGLRLPNPDLQIPAGLRCRVDFRPSAPPG